MGKGGGSCPMGDWEVPLVGIGGGGLSMAGRLDLVGFLVGFGRAGTDAFFFVFFGLRPLPFLPRLAGAFVNPGNANRAGPGVGVLTTSGVGLAAVVVAVGFVGT